MRFTYLTLSAAGLLVLCIILIIRQSGANSDEATGAAASPSASPAARKSDKTQAIKPRDRDAAAARPDTGLPDKPASDITTVPLKAPSPAPGIQLADDVQLPAVILAINAAEKDPENKMTAPIAAAMHAIVETFYQDLAASALENRPGESPPETGADNTLVIKPGPAVERARDKANETYRALFGDEAYNQMLMSAALEARLPVTPDGGGK
jgi:hypothetical protein